MELDQRKGLFAGVAVLSFGAVVLQIVLTRLYSALYGHHLAFLAISLSLFGVALGGVLLYVFPGLARPEVVVSRMAYYAGGASGGTVVALLLLLHVRPGETLDGSALLWLALLYAGSAVPFVLVGLAVAAGIKHAAADIGRLYLVDLVGAALGGFGAIAVLRVGALRGTLVVAILFAAAALFLVWASRKAREARPADVPVVAAFALVSLVLLLGDLGTPWLKLKNMRWVSTEKVEFTAWNELALITVDRSSGGMAWMRTDGSAATAILDTKTLPPAHPDEMGYVLQKEKGPVLVIGAGGGRDIRAALKHGQTDIHAAEINPLIVEDVLRGKYKTFSGDLFSRPEVHIEVADGRSYVRRSPLLFRNIVISLVDTWAAASVGALSLTENGLYTVEAFQDDLKHLTPEGTLVVNRWDGEFDRLLALSVEALRREGAEKPADHLFACSSQRSTALLVRRTPLGKEQIADLRKHCRKNKFVEVFAPDDAHDPLRERIATMPARLADPDRTTDISPPTDDRPFFFYTVPPRLFGSALLDWRTMAKENQGIFVLVGLLLVSALFAIVFLLGPLFLRPSGAFRAADRRQRLSALGYFFALGGGFVLVEVALVQHFTMFLGHPVYALSTVLVALLLWAGVGSFLTNRVSAGEEGRAAMKRARMLAGLLAVYALVLGPFLSRAVVLPLPVRLLLTLLMLAPLGVLMGAATPLGIRVVGARSPEIIPWCWGIGGVASVVATLVAPLVAMNAGFAAVLLAGAVGYLVASLALLEAARTPAPGDAAPSDAVPPSAVEPIPASAALVDSPAPGGSPQ